jgi:hypothetical protein
MPDLTPLSPLMQPVEWQGNTYFSSQYFHQQYNEQKKLEGTPAKYTQHVHFLRRIRTIESYQRFVGANHIVTIAWKTIKEGPIPYRDRLQPLFKATGYYDIMLLDATAQIELTHHLDDELSKEISYRHSREGARQLSQKTSDLLPSEIALRDAKAFQEFGAMWKIPDYIVQQETVKYIDTHHGINLRTLLLGAPAQRNIQPEDQMLEPAELAKRFGLQSGAYLNRCLETVGWQVKRVDNTWEATPIGKSYSAPHAWMAGNKSGFNLIWNIEAVRQILRKYNLLPEAPPQQEQLPI